MKFEWIEIPSGKFIMGTPQDEIFHLEQAYQSHYFQNEGPQKEVYLDPFEISKYPVTNEQYRSFIDATGYHHPPSPYFAWFLEGNEAFATHPVAWISWYDALAFCQWVGCRLPTGAEWEKAARGPNGFRYPWGNVWLSDYCNSIETSLRKTTPITLYPQGASFYGVQDMVGNIWEWTDDWVSTNLIATKQTANPTSDKSNDEHLPHFVHYPVLRGGSTIASQIGVRCAFRFIKYSPWDWGDWVGFRCVKFQKRPLSKR